MVETKNGLMHGYENSVNSGGGSPEPEKSSFVVAGIVIMTLSISLSFITFTSVYSASVIEDPYKSIDAESLRLIEYSEQIQNAKDSWASSAYSMTVSQGQAALRLAVSDEEKSVAHFWIGVGYYKQGQLTDAQTNEESSIAYASDYYAPYVTLGAIMLEKGNLTGAKELADKAIELEPNYAWAHNLLGMVLYQEGEREDAIASFSKAIELEPDNEVFRQNMDIARRGQ